jgi:hypothetical protein
MLETKKLTMAFLARSSKKFRELAFFLVHILSPRKIHNKESISKVYSIFILCLVSLFCFFPTAHADEKRLPFKGYGSYFPQFKLFCEAIHQDGRGEYLSKTALLFSERDTGCEACRPLFQTIVQTCKAPPKKKEISKVTKKPEEATGETDGEKTVPPTPTATPLPILNREPSALVIDRSVRLFNQIAEDKNINERSVPALYKLFFVLNDNHSATAAEKEYFDILQSFVMPLFAELQNKSSSTEPNEHGSSNEAASGEHLESLFDQ